MPSIRDINTVKALAREYCSNDRCKEKAMIAVGYTKAYANSYCGKMWENKSLIKEIGLLVDKKVAAFKLDATAVLDRLSKIAGLTPVEDDDDIKSITSADQIRGLDLLGKHLKLWDRAGEQLTDDKPRDLSPEEEAQLKRDAILINNTRAGQTKTG